MVKKATIHIEKEGERIKWVRATDTNPNERMNGRTSEPNEMKNKEERKKLPACVLLLPFVWVHVFGFVVRRRLRIVPTLFSLWLWTKTNYFSMRCFPLFHLYHAHTQFTHHRFSLLYPCCAYTSGYVCVRAHLYGLTYTRTVRVYSTEHTEQRARTIICRASHSRNTLISIARSLAYSFISSCTLLPSSSSPSSSFFLFLSLFCSCTLSLSPFLRCFFFQLFFHQDLYSSCNKLAVVVLVSTDFFVVCCHCCCCRRCRRSVLLFFITSFLRSVPSFPVALTFLLRFACLPGWLAFLSYYCLSIVVIVLFYFCFINNIMMVSERKNDLIARCVRTALTK